MITLLNILNSRHRAFKNILAFNKVSNDQLTSADLYPISSSGLFFVEITIDTSRFTDGFYEAIIGNHDENANNVTQWLIQKSNVGGLRFLYTRNNTIIYDDFIADYPSEVVTIRGEWDDSGVFLYVNGDLKATNATVIRPNAPTGPILVGGRNGIQQANFDLYSININNEHIWLLPEGNGYPITSETTSRVMTGSTDNVGGLTYWDENVWKKVTL